MAEAKGILEYLGIPWVETEEETDYQAEARAAVDWLTENGIMQGNAEGDLMLDQPLTRRQFAVLEYRIAKLEGGSVTPPETEEYPAWYSPPGT